MTSTSSFSRAARAIAVIALSCVLGAGATAQQPSVMTEIARAANPDIRPMDLWVHDGATVIHGDFRRRTEADRAIDYPVQSAAVRRWANLLMFANSPDLADHEGVLEYLAAENLAREPHGRMLQRCPFGQTSGLDRCAWSAANEFERARLGREFAKAYLPAILELAAAMPRELVFVENYRLGPYDAERQGFPVERGYADKVILRGMSIFGGMTRIEFAADDSAIPDFLPLDPAAAEALLGRFSGRNAALAIRYAVRAIVTPEDGTRYEFRRFILEPLGMALYADSGLTDFVLDLSEPLAPAPAVSAPAQADPIEEIPLTLTLHEGRPVVYATPQPEGVQAVRVTHLLAIGQDGAIASDERIASLLAEQNFIGLTRTHGARGWLGATEFDRARNQALYMEHGTAQLVALAATLGSKIVLVQRATLDTYDFAREAFPLDYSGSYQPGLGTSVRLFLGSPGAVVNGRLFFAATDLPEAWPVPLKAAEAAFERYTALTENLRLETARAVRVVSHVSITGFAEGALRGEVTSVSLYADDALEIHIADLAVAPGPSP